MRDKSETWLAALSIAVGVLNLGGETVTLVLSGFLNPAQLPSLILTFVGLVLLVAAGAWSLQTRPRSAAGLLSGAWGFALGSHCAYAISQTERLWPAQAALEGTPPHPFVVANLALALVIAVIFAWSLFLAIRQTPRHVPDTMP